MVDKIEMSLDDIIKANKKTKGFGGGKRRAPVAGGKTGGPKGSPKKFGGAAARPGVAKGRRSGGIARPNARYTRVRLRKTSLRQLKGGWVELNLSAEYGRCRESQWNSRWRTEDRERKIISEGRFFTREKFRSIDRCESCGFCGCLVKKISVKNNVNSQCANIRTFSLNHETRACITGSLRWIIITK